ncbi:MAG: hypothetical protein N3F63_00070 [Thermoplasmata archaeon]|nr:hypothetical protein [Thermoplasmata archaeon]
MNRIHDDCELWIPFRKILPRKPVDYPFSVAISDFFKAGNYSGYRTVHAGASLLTEVTSYKFVYRNQALVRMLIAELSAYLDAWKQCIKHHEHREGTTCFNPGFRAMLYSGISEIEECLTAKIPGIIASLDDFDMAVEFVNAWNEIQHTMMVTYYANLIAFPNFLKQERCLWDDDLTCAMCTLGDRKILNPTPNFLFLSGFFTPDDFLLPNGKTIAQGVYVHERAGEREILHEHVHGYLHQCRRVAEQILCDYLDEGFAEWCAISLKRPEQIPKGIFREKYDFWIVLNSLPEEIALKLFDHYISASRSINWKMFVKEATECIVLHREAHRSKKFWRPDEHLDREHIEKLCRFIMV